MSFLLEVLPLKIRQREMLEKSCLLLFFLITENVCSTSPEKWVAIDAPINGSLKGESKPRTAQRLIEV